MITFAPASCYIWLLRWQLCGHIPTIMAPSGLFPVAGGPITCHTLMGRLSCHTYLPLLWWGVEWWSYSINWWPSWFSCIYAGYGTENVTKLFQWIAIPGRHWIISLRIHYYNCQTHVFHCTVETNPTSKPMELHKTQIESQTHSGWKWKLKSSKDWNH